MGRASIPNVLVGVADTGRQQARRVAPIGMRAVGSTLRPASQLYRSPPVTSARARATDLSATLAREGQAALDRAGAQARATGAEVLGRLISAILNHPATEALLDEALADPGLERLLDRVIDSQLVADLTTRFVDSDEMQVVLDHVTRSPELRAALSRQTAGLAEDVAVGMRSRTATADDTSERLAQQFMRRLRKPAAS